MGVSGAVADSDQGSGNGAATRKGGTPIWVAIVYFLGLLGALLVVFALVVRFLPVTVHMSPVAVVVWIGLVVLALAVLVVRRRRS